MNDTQNVEKLQLQKTFFCEDLEQFKKKDVLSGLKNLDQKVLGLFLDCFSRSLNNIYHSMEKHEYKWYVRVNVILRELIEKENKIKYQATEKVQNFADDMLLYRGKEIDFEFDREFRYKEVFLKVSKELKILMEIMSKRIEAFDELTKTLKEFLISTSVKIKEYQVQREVEEKEVNYMDQVYFEQFDEIVKKISLVEKDSSSEFLFDLLECFNFYLKLIKKANSDEQVELVREFEQFLEQSTEKMNRKEIPQEIDRLLKDAEKISKLFDEILKDIKDSDSHLELSKQFGGIEFDFNNLIHHITEDTATNGPKYLTLTRGLNLLGNCQNLSCDAYKRRVVIMKGIGKFHISSEKYNSNCPSCNKIVDPHSITNMAFFDCKYQIEGHRLKPNAGSFNMESQVEPRKFETFKEGNNTDAVWAYIDVHTSLKAVQKSEDNGRKVCQIQ